MKTVHPLVAERALASHCPELLIGAAGEADAREELRSEFAASLCTQLGRRLQPLLAGKPVRFASEVGGAATAYSLAQSIGPCAANFTIECGPQRTVFLVSFDLGTANALTDRLFGGDGMPGEDEPQELAPSSVLALERVALAAAQAIGVSGYSSDAAKVARHHINMARLNPYPLGDYCLSWTVTAAQDGAESWHMQIAARAEDIDAMVSGGGRHTSQRRQGGKGNPQAEPFATIPLQLRAVLAEFKLPLARLAALTPGETIPLAIARDVPLKIEQRVLARGKVGVLDDRVALRLVNHGNGEFGQ